jgi:methyl-accepting chemotaxis protein
MRMQRYALTQDIDDEYAFEPRLGAADEDASAAELARQALALKAAEPPPSPARGLMLHLAARLNGADRRNGLRLPFAAQVFMLVDGRILPTRSRDIGEGGMLLERPADLIEAADRRVEIQLPGLCRLAGDLVGIARETLSVRFVFQAGAEAAHRGVAALTRLLKQRNAEELRGAHALGDQIEAAFLQMLRADALPADLLIAGVLTPRLGSDPPQFDHPAKAVFERRLHPLLDAWVATRPDVLHAAAIDQRGYVAALSAPFRQPQKPGEPVLNQNLSQDAMLRSDPWSLSAARLSPLPLVQTRSRDLAPQHGATVRTVSVPIRIRERRWGALEAAHRAFDDALLSRVAESAGPSPA